MESYRKEGWMSCCFWTCDMCKYAYTYIFESFKSIPRFKVIKWLYIYNAVFKIPIYYVLHMRISWNILILYHIYLYRTVIHMYTLKQNFFHVRIVTLHFHFPSKNTRTDFEFASCRIPVTTVLFLLCFYTCSLTFANL